MTTHRHDDTDKIEINHVCLEHSGVCANMKTVIRNQEDLWGAVGQMRAMFATTMISLVGGLGLILWAVLSKKVGL